VKNSSEILSIQCTSSRKTTSDFWLTQTEQEALDRLESPVLASLGVQGVELGVIHLQGQQIVVEGKELERLSPPAP